LKRYMYFLSIVSSIILTALLITRGKYLAAALASLVAILYTFGIFYDARQTKKEGEARAKNNPKSEAEPSDRQIIDDLKEMNRNYGRNMRIFRNATFTLAIISAVIVFLNESLAIAIAIVALASFFKFYQNYKAIRKIRQGLAAKGYDRSILEERPR